MSQLVREGFLEEVTLELRPEGGAGPGGGKCVPGRGNSKGRGPGEATNI